MNEQTQEKNHQITTPALRINEWMNEWMIEWMNEWMNKWVEQSQFPVFRCVHASL